MTKTADEYRNLASHAHHELQYRPADWGTGTRTRGYLRRMTAIERGQL